MPFVHTGPYIGNIKADGVHLTNLNGNSVTTGTIANARLPDAMVVNTLITHSLLGDGSLLTFSSLGIGTTDPMANLHVIGNGIVTGDLAFGISDARLKTNIRDIDNPMQRLSHLHGVFYEYNEIAGTFGFRDDVTHAGVLAQDVAIALPEAVCSAPFDADPETGSRTGEFYKTVKYERIVPLLVECIHELQAKIATLEARMSAATTPTMPATMFTKTVSKDP